MTLSEILSRIESVTRHKPVGNGSGHVCRCPAHDDHNPSLSVREGEQGKVLLHCHAGCSFEDILKALNLSAADLATAGKRRGPGRPPKATLLAAYDYQDASGKLLFQVCRMDPKEFRQRRPDEHAPGGWAWNLKGVRQVPYRLPELISAVKGGQTVYIAEGEKDVAALVTHGFAATCNAGGAGKWRDEFGEHLDGAKSVVVIADKDVPGRSHAAAVAAKLKPLVRSAKVIELPDIAAKPVKDAADYFAAGGTVEALQRLADETPEYVPRAELTPRTWFKQRFPTLAEKYGEPVLETATGKRAVAKEVSEDFMAATLGTEGTPDAPTVFLPTEQRFYAYNPAAGIFERQREEDIAAKLSALFLECGRTCGDAADTTRMLFRMRKGESLIGIVKRAKGTLAVPDEYFVSDHSEFLAVANGMLRLSDRALLPFSPSYRCRNKLAVSYVENAYPKLFRETLMGPALEAFDITLIQRWSGLALVGINHSQKIILLTGTAGGGKSTLVSVVIGIIGHGNVGMLRTELLGDRFEIGRLTDKTILYGPDVPEDFLSKRTASSLKSLTGGDMVTAEFKNSNESPQVKCQFNVIVTSNSRLTVYLEGDADAWRRRLAIVDFSRPKPKEIIPNLAGRIITEEGPGVLNFMLDGLDALRKANWQLTMNERQQRRVDNLLLESDSHRVFVAECLVKDTESPGMTKAAVHAAYVEYCDRRGWVAMNRNRFGKLGADAIAQNFGLAVRGDIRGEDGKQNDGWKYLRLKSGNDPE